MGSSLTPTRGQQRGQPQQGGYAGLQRLNSMLDQMFGTLPMPDISAALTSAWLPPVDVFEDQDSVKIVAEIPGVDFNDLTLSIENNVLTIRGEKRQTREDRTDRVHRYERTYGFFERSFVLPATVDPDRIEANLDNGVLTISVPKAEKARPRQIEVRGGAQGSGQGQTGGQRSAAQVGAGSADAAARGAEGAQSGTGSTTGAGASGGGTGSSKTSGSSGRGNR
jgi:HSP20 family protein